MNLGKTLQIARKKAGLTQESVAEKLNISRQTISKWEQNETIPNLYESKKLADLYHITIDELFTWNYEQKEIEQIIENTSEETTSKIDWTKTWSKKYPVLKEYTKKVKLEDYIKPIHNLLNKLKQDYQYNDLDSMLVLKDILYKIWKEKK